MEKLHCQTDQDELVRAAGRMVALIDGSSHVKEAASNALTREMLEGCRPDKDHFLLHVIALGDHERFGPNRNGDAFPKKACEKYHKTFVTHGHFFREHKNRDPKHAIGQIKASCYNAPMGRVELAVWGHNKKAEDVREKAAANDPTSFSMSCRVPVDRSSITGKLARTPADYDDYCKHRMGQWIPEHNKFAFVYNDDPTFFDISYVKNPADRIAHHLEYFIDGQRKAASVSGVNGVELAQEAGVSLPAIMGCASLHRQALLTKLAALEREIESGQGDAAVFVKHAGRNLFRGELTEEQLAHCKSIEPGVLFAKLAARQVLLPFTSFAAYATGSTIAEAQTSAEVQAARAELPAVFRKIAGTPNELEIETAFEATLDRTSPHAVERALDGITEVFSANPGYLLGRAIKNACVTGPMPPAQAISAFTKLPPLAYCYGHYKLAALEAIHELHPDAAGDRLLVISLSQNRII